MIKTFGVALLAGATLAGAASSAVITAPVGTYYAFPTDNYFGPGPITVAPGIVWSSTNATNQGGSVYGYDGGYGFNNNGFDSATLTGLNDNSDNFGVVDSMTFSFSTPVSAVGGVLNWASQPSYLAPSSISVYDTSDNLIESLTLYVGGVDLVTPNSFYGFQESSATISKFVLTDGYVAVIGGLSATTASVPEASTWALMLVGVAGLGAALRTSRRRTAIAV